MTALYWAGEYVKVLGGYLFLMFLWPSVVFNWHLKGKSKIYQFSFCSVVQIVLLNTLVLGFGLLRILNRWTLDLVIYGLFFACLLRRVPWSREMLEQLYRLLTGTCGKKLFFLKLFKLFLKWIKGKLQALWQMVRPRLVEYVLLLAVLIYAMIYFSWGAFQDYSYGTSDIYTHHQWIYGLVEGKAFAGSIYPEGMHCFVYSLYALFGIRIYSILLFLQGIHVTALILSVYCLMREIFHWRYTPFFALAMFLTLCVYTYNGIFCMSRLQWTLPQEFGLHTQFICALYLVRYLKSAHIAVFKKRVSKYYWDENLFLFMMALAASLVTHFYVTIMAFFLCACFVLCMLHKLFDKKRLIPLVAAVLCGFSVAVLPMMGGLASGIPFHGSMGWALSLIEGTTEDGMGIEEGVEEPVSEEDSTVAEENLDDLSFWQALKNKAFILYSFGYSRLYPGQGGWVVGLTCFAIVLSLTYLATVVIRKHFEKQPVGGKWISGYLPVAFASVVFMVLYAAPYLEIPELIASVRMCTVEQLLILMVVVIPIDMLFSLLEIFMADVLLQGLSVLIAGGICSWVVLSGNYHGFLFCSLTRYNAVEKTTNSIIDVFPQNTYTIVSPVDELYPVIEYGRHEELLSFIKKVSVEREEEYKIPTEHVFLFVEKRPIKWAHIHFFQGPSWLANDRYFYDSVGISNVSLCPNVVSSEISAESARKSIPEFGKLSEAYSDLDNRTILESKLYLWCQAFSQNYPFELQVYYEDDDFICYSFRQNTNALYNLNLKGWEETDGVRW